MDTAPYAETDTCWHLMVKTRGGKVTMLPNLDAPTARQAYRNLRSEEWPVKYINGEGLLSWGSGGRICSDSDIRGVDIIGPKGAVLDPWRDVESRIVDLAPERERQEAYKKRADAERERALEKAKSVGALKELTPQISRAFRCYCCGKMQPNDSLLFYVPDGVRKGDDIEAIRDRVKESRFNGHGSGWCASCVPKEPRLKAAATAAAPTLLGRIFGHD